MSISVWLADDHAVFRSGIRVLLENEPDITVAGEAGCDVDTLQAVAGKKFDILLLDITMPGLSGPKVAERALQTRPNLAIVILTMHEDEYYLQELFRIGARGYILKKSTGTELVQAIRAVFRGDNYIDPALTHLVISPYVGKPTVKTPTRLDTLTAREQEVCRLLAYGYTNAEVAQKLFISDRTVESHRTNIMNKLDLRSRAELVRFAIDNGLLKTE